MVHEAIYRVTENVEYDVIDKRNKVLLGKFETMEGAEGFLMNNPIYRHPGIEIVPTLTHRDVKSLDYIMSCMSHIYDIPKKNWADNQILDSIIKDFVDKIDTIRSDKSIIGYI